MSTTNCWLLPEGVEEILPPKAMQLENIRRSIIDLLATWGYELVIPPMVEYLESLLTGTGEDLDLKTFKVTDQLNGRLIGIRADMTPQVARIDAHLLKRETPTRLCYYGSVLHTRPSKAGETRSPLQLGAELYGHTGVASDIEIVQLMLATLKHTSIEQVCMDIGHSGVFRLISAESGLSDRQRQDVFELLQRKAKDELRAAYKSWNITDNASIALLDLVDLHGDVSVLAQAEHLFKNLSVEISAYLEEVRTLVEVIQDQTGVSVNVDLAELRGYFYHSGMVYTAFVPGRGEGIAFGGRYDDIGKAFGRARPATGFSLDIKSLLKYEKTAPLVPERIFAPVTTENELNNKVAQLRAAGKTVVQALAGQRATAVDMDCQQQLVYENDNWVIKKV